MIIWVSKRLIRGRFSPKRTSRALVFMIYASFLFLERHFDSISYTFNAILLKIVDLVELCCNFVCVLADVVAKRVFHGVTAFEH